MVNSQTGVRIPDSQSYRAKRDPGFIYPWNPGPGRPMESRPSLSGAGYEVWGDRGTRWARGPVDKRMIVELVIKGWVWEGFTPPKGIPERL